MVVSRTGLSRKRRNAPPLPAPRIVVSSRVRLARNLCDEKFPDWASDDERKQTLQRVAAAASSAGLPAMLALDAIETRNRELMVEQWLISRDLAEGRANAGVVVGDNFSIMVNEEDHIRIQAFTPGLDLLRCWRMADELDTQLEKKVPYAFSERLGYLTACPSNVGTGMRASVMVHLPGLRLAGDLDPVIRGLERLRLTVRGIGGEGSPAAGHRFQISNQGTLGAAELDTIRNLEKTVAEVARQEALARRRVWRDMALQLEDCLERSLALLQHAKLLQTEEALDYLSAVRMGVEMGLISGIAAPKINFLEQMAQPGHLQQMANETLESEERDLRRAELANSTLRGCTVDTRHIYDEAKQMNDMMEKKDK